MAQLKLSEAARQVGVSRPTIYKYVQDGKLSVTTDRKGQKQVEVSELLRVFGALKSETEIQTDRLDRGQHRLKLSETTPAVALQIEVATLRAQLDARAAEVAMLKDRVDELKTREAQADQERARILAMLEQSQRLLAAPAAPPAPAPAPTRTRTTTRTTASKASPASQAIPAPAKKKATTTKTTSKAPARKTAKKEAQPAPKAGKGKKVKR